MENVSRETRNGTGERLREAVTDLKDNLKDNFQDAGKQTAASAKKIAEELTTVGKDALETCTEEGKKQLNTVEEYVRLYPVRSMLISAAAGIFLSRIIKS